MENNENQPIEVQSETRETIEQQVTPPSINWKKEVFEWSQAIIIALVIALIIKTFLFTLVVVSGPSMQNTLQDGDRLFVYRLMYQPKDGDIVVFTPEQDKNRPYIKRVIATEGQTIDINFKTAEVSVDGKVLSEKYIKMPTTQQFDVKFPITVPAGHVFVMGDNRGNSHDSRTSTVGSYGTNNGMVKNESIMGKALFRIWPFNQFGSLYK